MPPSRPDRSCRDARAAPWWIREAGSGIPPADPQEAARRVYYAGALRPGAVRARPAGLEGIGERRESERRGRFGAAAEAEGQHRLPRQLSEERDVAGTGGRVFPGHRAITREILPAIAVADEAGAATHEGVRLLRRDRCEGEGEGTLLGPQHAPPAVAQGLRAVVVSGPAEMRREQRIGLERRIARERHLDEEHVP